MRLIRASERRACAGHDSDESQGPRLNDVRMHGICILPAAQLNTWKKMAAGTAYMSTAHEHSQHKQHVSMVIKHDDLDHIVGADLDLSHCS